MTINRRARPDSLPALRDSFVMRNKSEMGKLTVNYLAGAVTELVLSRQINYCCIL